MTIADLTPRQTEVLEYLTAYHATHGFAPSLREMCRDLSMASTNAARDHLIALAEKGVISRADRKSRGTVLTNGAARKTEVLTDEERRRVRLAARELESALQLTFGTYADLCRTLGVAPTMRLTRSEKA